MQSWRNRRQSNAAENSANITIGIYGSNVWLVAWWNSVYAAAEEIRTIARVRPTQLTIRPPVAKAASNRATSLMTISMPIAILRATGADVDLVEARRNQQGAVGSFLEVDGEHFGPDFDVCHRVDGISEQMTGLDRLVTVADPLGHGSE